MKLVIDTNIWISFLFGKSFKELNEIINNSYITIFTSKEQIFEINDVISRPKFDNLISTQSKNNLIYYFNYKFKVIDLENNIKICRDPKDDYLLETATKSNSNFIITGDKDLLDLKIYEAIKIINFKEFIDLYLE